MPALQEYDSDGPGIAGTAWPPGSSGRATAPWNRAAPPNVKGAAHVAGPGDTTDFTRAIGQTLPSARTVFMPRLGNKAAETGHA